MRISILAAALSTVSMAHAAVPVVVTDTAPVHALVAMVMGDLGEPARLIPPGTSPHDAALRPSDAAALSQAGLVIWSGTGLVPYLADPIATLAPSAEVLSLLDDTDWPRLPLRDHAAFSRDDHDHDHDHDHGDHADDHDHDHALDSVDPHGWLSPAVAQAWIDSIAASLIAQDPENAEIYAANAQAARAEITALQAEITEVLAPVAGRPYFVPHDAYQYFETAFDMPAAGAIALSDAVSAGPAHVAEMQKRIADEGIACVLSDPQTSPDLLALVIEGSDAKTAAADPDGQDLTPGAALYPAMMKGLAAALAACLS